MAIEYSLHEMGVNFVQQVESLAAMPGLARVEKRLRAQARRAGAAVELVLATGADEENGAALRMVRNETMNAVQKIYDLVMGTEEEDEMAEEGTMDELMLAVGIMDDFIIATSDLSACVQLEADRRDMEEAVLERRNLARKRLTVRHRQAIGKDTGLEEGVRRLREAVGADVNI